MARGKKNNRASPKDPPYGKRSSKRQSKSQPSGFDSADYGDGEGQPSFSLRDEAFHTGRHAVMSSSTRLRDIGVTFVSAGNMENDDEDQSTVEGDVDDQNSSQRDQNIEHLEAATSPPKLLPATEHDDSHLGFVVDVVGMQSLADNSRTVPFIRPSSPSSVSSEEVILFSGRKQPPTVVEDPFPLSTTHQATGSRELQRDSGASCGHKSSRAASYSRARAKRSVRMPRVQQSRRAFASAAIEMGLGEEDSDIDEEALADYLANLTNDGGEDKSQHGSSDIAVDVGMQSTRRHKQARVSENGGQYAGMLSDMSKSPNTSADDSEVAEEGELDDGLDSDDDEDEDDEEEDYRDQEDILQRRVERMDDETIARLLAKQEELGLDSGELLLFDGSDVPAAEMNDLIADNESRPSRKERRNRERKARRDDHFPSATLTADILEYDPYQGFDIMDLNRPSLRKAAKRRRGVLPFELDLSDDELAAGINEQWAKDRKKKAERKREREELRAQGLLGKGYKGKPLLGAKYQEGLTLNQLMVEIKDFMLSTLETCPLPPMGAADRKVIHDVANALGLKSKSVGKRNDRFPVLYKTSRTPEYDEESFIKVASSVSRRFFWHEKKTLSKARKMRNGKPQDFSTRRSHAQGAFSYRDGDIVGAAAPELGSENRGRTMLEKMGWSTGTALGAMNNKGILQPVVHVVKTSKAGLG